jgi:hypothetical protein
VTPVRPRQVTSVTLRAALLLLAGVSVFALGLLPAHPSSGAHSSPDASPAHLMTGHASLGHHTTHDAPEPAATAAGHTPGGHGSHGDQPLCHSGQTSSSLICQQVGTADLTLLLMSLLAAGLVAVLVVGTPLPAPERTRWSRWPRPAPIRPAFGPRLFLLDCVART